MSALDINCELDQAHLASYRNGKIVGRTNKLFKK